MDLRGLSRWFSKIDLRHVVISFRKRDIQRAASVRFARERIPEALMSVAEVTIPRIGTTAPSRAFFSR
jgi:hypothetical protein